MRPFYLSISKTVLIFILVLLIAVSIIGKESLSRLVERLPFGSFSTFLVEEDSADCLGKTGKSSVICDVERLISDSDRSVDLDPSDLQVGVHAARYEDMKEFEDLTGVELDTVAVHIHWGNESDFPTEYAEEVKRRGATLFIFWNPMDYNRSNEEQQEFHYSRILTGSWDSYIDGFVEDVADYGGPVIVAPIEEPNGYWTPWSGLEGRFGTPEQYREVFRYLHKRFQTAPNVEFAWVVNHVSVPDVPENGFVHYYPGPEAVDIIGINAFNFGDPWLSFDLLVQSSVNELWSYKKPLFITSTASAEGEDKAAWVNGFLNSPYFSKGIFKGFIWFNEDKERNWLIWSDPQSLEVFREGLSDVGEGR